MPGNEWMWETKRGHLSGSSLVSDDGFFYSSYWNFPSLKFLLSLKEQDEILVWIIAPTRSTHFIVRKESHGEVLGTFQGEDSRTERLSHLRFS